MTNSEHVLKRSEHNSKNTVTDFNMENSTEKTKITTFEWTDSIRSNM